MNTTTAQTTPVADSRPEPPEMGDRYVVVYHFWGELSDQWLWTAHRGGDTQQEADVVADQLKRNGARSVRVVRIPGDGK